MSAKRAPKCPLNIKRITTIMKSSSEVDNVGKESALIMTHAAILFIERLAKEAYLSAENPKTLDYKHLAAVVQSDDKYDFVRDMMPQKITVLQYKQIMAKLNGEEKEDNSTDDSTDQDSDSDDSENSSTTSKASA